MASRFRSRRTALDLSQGQAGDLAAGTIAGGDAYQGLDGPTLLRVLEGTARDREHVAAQLEGLREQLRGHELMQAKRDERDTADRAQRQSALDTTLAELQRGQRTTRYWLAGLALVWLVGLLILAWLVYDRYTAAAALRLWLGGGAALVTYIWRR